MSERLTAEEETRIRELWPNNGLNNIFGRDVRLLLAEVDAVRQENARLRDLLEEYAPHVKL
jgi:hypothetical protein